MFAWGAGLSISHPYFQQAEGLNSFTMSPYHEGFYGLSNLLSKNLSTDGLTLNCSLP